MNENIFKKYEEELNTILEENDLKIKELTNKEKILNFKNTEDRFGLILVFTALPFFIFMISSLAGLGTILGSILPAKLIPYLLLGTSIGCGFIGEKHLTKKYLKEKVDKYNELTKDKSKEEIKELQTLNELEIEKSVSKKKILKKVIELFNSNKNLYNLMNEKYNVVIKETNNDTSLSKINNLKKEIENKIKELENIKTRNYLSKKYFDVRDKFQMKSNPLINGLMLGMFSMLMMFGLFMGVKELITFKTLIESLLYPIIPLIIGGATATTIMYLENKINKKVFNKIIKDNNLEELNEKVDYDKEKEYEKLEKELINQISKLSNDLIEEKMMYEQRENTRNENSNNKENKKTNDESLILDGPTLNKKLD